MSSTVRHDRKFYVSLRLHERVLEHLSQDPERVRRIGLERVEVRRVRVRGESVGMIDEWESILRSRDWDTVRRYLTGEDEKSVEMRNLSVFGGVISEEERRSVLDSVYVQFSGNVHSDAPGI